MGACGCAENSPQKVYGLRKGCYLGVAPYLGCDYCDTGIGYDLTFMNEHGRRNWADGIPLASLEFARDPADGSSFMLGCVGINELREAAKKLRADGWMADGFKDFRSVDEWLEEYGLMLLQEAFRIHLKQAERK